MPLGFGVTIAPSRYRPITISGTRKPLIGAADVAAEADQGEDDADHVGDAVEPADQAVSHRAHDSSRARRPTGTRGSA